MTRSDDYPTRVGETLGFYPSYLEAVDDHPAYAELAWVETQRVLTAPGDVPAARQLAAAATPAIAAELPAERVDADLDETLRFFSFVVFRLGTAIAACRYALDGEATRAAHARPIPAGTDHLPPTIADAVEFDLPRSPELGLVQPDDATGEVADLYDRVLADLDTPNVNNIFRGLASDPVVLERTVDACADVEAARPDLDRTIRAWYAQALAEHDLRPGSHRVELRRQGYDNATIDEVASRIRAFHENLPTLVATLVTAVVLTDG